jgi:hypothetical protein
MAAEQLAECVLKSATPALLLQPVTVPNEISYQVSGGRSCGQLAAVLYSYSLCGCGNWVCCYDS